jgi:hypothetical protein
VKIFKRSNQLEGLLESVKSTGIETVYVADDGELTQKKKQIYQRNYEFNLTILDLEYDAGLGYGRSEIVKKSDEEYLLIVDSDHRVPRNVSTLHDQLTERPDIGGISGLLLENGSITGVCHDLYERKDILIRDVKKEKKIEEVNEYPLIKYDFLPNIAMFRKDCLEDYCWDPEYVIGKEHLDFYVGHMKNTDWKFGVNPCILFNHYPNSGNEEYRKNRESIRKLNKSKKYFLNKWGYKNIFLGQTSWVNHSNIHSHNNLKKRVLKNLFTKLPHSVQNSVLSLRDRRRMQNGRGPI